MEAASTVDPSSETLVNDAPNGKMPGLSQLFKLYRKLEDDIAVELGIDITVQTGSYLNSYREEKSCKVCLVGMFLLDKHGLSKMFLGRPRNVTQEAGLDDYYGWGLDDGFENHDPEDYTSAWDFYVNGHEEPTALQVARYEAGRAIGKAFALHLGIKHESRD